jgi:hypothetical protein
MGQGNEGTRKAKGKQQGASGEGRGTFTFPLMCDSPLSTTKEEGASLIRSLFLTWGMVVTTEMNSLQPGFLASEDRTLRLICRGGY